MKNFNKADKRNNETKEKTRIRYKEKGDLDKMLIDQRDKHTREEEDMNDLCRQQDSKHMNEKNDLDATINKQKQKHRQEKEECVM